MRHVTLAFRTLFKTPFVTGIAIVSLALGIGANAAIFSLFDQILLRPLPVPDPARLVNLAAPGPKPGSQSCGQAGDCDVVFSYPMFRDLERSQTVFTGLASHLAFGVSLSYRDQPTTGDGMYVSGSYFPTLGLRPALGRLLTPADDQGIGTHYVTVLGYGYWQSHFGGDPAVLGRPLRVNGQAMTIVGVAPPDFHGTTLGVRPLVFVPISMRGVLSPGFRGFENRQSYWAYLFGRLKPGVSLAQASAGLNALYHPIVTDVEAPLQKGISDQMMAQFQAKQVVLTPGWRGQSSVPQDAKAPLLMLFGVTAIVLLIACANIANLLLARGAGRAMEMGVRLALGAHRRQLMSQLLTESVLLAGLGAVAGLIVANWTLTGIAAILPPDFDETLRFALQPVVLVFAAALALGTGIVFGVFPAWHSTRIELVTAIRANAVQISGARSAARFRASLVTMQVALATTLLIAAGLFVKSLDNVSRVDLGLHVDDVVAFSIAPERIGYDSTRALSLYGRVEDALGSIPGVKGVTSSVIPLLAGNNWGSDVNVQGFPSGPDVDKNARLNEVGAGYFATLGVQLRAGREFTPADHRGAPRVAVVNQAFEKKFNLGQGAVGTFTSIGPGPLNIQIVGVVPDVKYSDVKQAVPAMFYTPWRQDTHVGTMSFYVRSPQPEALLRALPAVLKQIDAGLPMDGLKTMPQQIRENVVEDRLIGIVSASFAVLATVLAAVGLYGVLAYSVAQRTREIGVRMALGADAGRVRALVLRQMSRMMLVGSVVGLLGALGLGRAAQSLLYGLKGHDPVVFALAAALLTLVALGAVYVPARRASLVDPVRALRYE
ncbi:MAG: multidrug ABC transporter substrate-binding protein [Gemmatimonadetes bacterium]|nr:MAG: multidrug ABC transporter substrate-binding protein [Gemmatimonadota bacterium]